MQADGTFGCSLTDTRGDEEAEYKDREYYRHVASQVNGFGTHLVLQVRTPNRRRDCQGEADIGPGCDNSQETCHGPQ